LVFQNPFNQISGARFTVREEIAFGLENLGLGRSKIKDRIASSMELVGVADLANRSPFALSGGQQQRVAIASILAMQPKVLVLDEPTSQLDPRGSEEVFAALNALAEDSKTTVILVEHKLEWVAAFADRVVHLYAGQVVADGPASEVLVSEDAAKYGIEETIFTAVAREALKADLVSTKGALPITLEQGKAFLS